MSKKLPVRLFQPLFGLFMAFFMSHRRYWARLSPAAFARAKEEHLQPPDLVIYLQASVPVLQQRIRQRGRDYEQEIQVEYLTRLNDLYGRWVESFTLCPVLTVPTDEFDFVSHNAHLELIAARVLEKLHGKEVVVFQ